MGQSVIKLYESGKKWVKHEMQIIKQKYKIVFGAKEYDLDVFLTYIFCREREKVPARKNPKPVFSNPAGSAGAENF